MNFIEAVRFAYNFPHLWVRPTGSPQAIGVVRENGGALSLSWLPNNGKRIPVIVGSPADVEGTWEAVEPTTFLETGRAR